MNWLRLTSVLDDADEIEWSWEESSVQDPPRRRLHKNLHRQHLHRNRHQYKL